jgi:alanine racemase
LTRKTVATIDLDGLVKNFEQLKALAPNSQSLAVVKADAYGHGALQVAQALSKSTELFAVAFIDEAKALREQGISKPILSMQGALDADECAWAGRHNVHLVVHHEQQLQWIHQLKTNRPEIWPKIDTGMHRLGFQPVLLSAILKKYQHLISAQSVIFTHLASADEPQNGQTTEQLEQLDQSLKEQIYPLSIANSAGVIHWQAARKTWNRIGIGMYGGAIGPSGRHIQLKPVMALKASVIAIRDIPQGNSVGYGGTWTSSQSSCLATVGIGYADGYPRHAPNGTPAYCNGQRIYLVGRVSMDMLIFDVTHLPQVKLGDCVELWGDNVCITEVAEKAGTIDYELMTRISARVPREYV